MDAVLAITTLGGVRILRGGQPVLGLATRKTEALLLYLACTRRPQPREVLADLFWAEHSQDLAMGNLRKALSNLHQVLGECLNISRTAVELNPDASIWLDAAELEDGLKAIHHDGRLNIAAADQASRLLELYCGEFLEGFSVFDCLEFEQWAVREQERLHRLAVDSFAELVAFEIEQKSYQPGMAHAARLLALDPLNESGHRQMMRLLASSGQRSAALNQYETCQKLLQEELGVVPETETLQLYEQIRAGEFSVRELPEDQAGEPQSLNLPLLEEEPPAPGKAPFMGLQFFDEGDADLFFGRSQVTARLVEMASQQRFLAVIGASGSGKSSVVRAGLAPALQRSQPGIWETFILTPTAQPLEALAVRLTRGVESVSAAVTLLDDLRRDRRSLHLYLCKRMEQAEKGRNILLVIDQFEELFTMCHSEAERQAFIDNLLAAAQAPGSRVHVLITLRADFYDHLAEYSGLRQAVASQQEYLGAMNAAELRQAIEEPAKQGGWEFASGLVELMLHDVGAEEDRPPEPGALPLLSHALLETWNHRRGKVMHLKSYAESGGVHRAIARTAERLYSQELNPEQQEIARNIFLRLTELGEGTQDTRRRASLQELYPPAPYGNPKDVEEVLVKLADARLIITGEGTAEVAHEALIREWPMLREWLAQNRDGLLVLRRLTEAAQEWELLEQDAGSLYRGARLVQAVEWARANPQQLNELEQAFLEASQAAAQHEADEREAQRQRELEAARRLAETEKERAEAQRLRAEEQSRSARGLRRRAMYLVIALCLAAALAGAAAWLGLRAQSSARLATSRELTSAALNNMKVDPQLSALLVLRALQTEHTFEAESALHTVMPELRLLNITPIGKDASHFWWARDAELYAAGTPRGIEVIDFASRKKFVHKSGSKCLGVNPSTDGRWLVTLCAPNLMEVLETETGKVVFTFPDIGVPFRSAFVVPPTAAQPMLAYANYADLSTHVWDVSSGKERFVLKGHLPKSIFMRFPIACSVHSRDGKRLATWASDGLVIVWDLATGQKLLQFDAGSADIFWSDFSPDGTRLVTTGGNGMLKIWDIASHPDEPILLASVPIDTGGERLVFSTDGARVAVGGSDGTIRVIDAQSGKIQLVLTGHLSAVQTVAFSRDEKRLYSTSWDYTIREWDLTPGREALTLLAPRGAFTAIAYSPDGQQVVTGGGGFVTIWDSRSGVMQRSWEAPGFIKGGIAWSPDGKRIATGGDDNTPRIWEAATGQLLKELSGHAGPVSMVAWSPDSARLVTAGGEGAAIVWDAQSGKNLLTLSHPKLDLDAAKGVFGVAYSPDGQKIATGALNGTISIWAAATGKELANVDLNMGVWGMAFSPDGRRLATGLEDGQLILWQVKDTGLQKEQTFAAGKAGLYLSVAFSPDGTLLAAADLSNKIRVWDLKAGRERWSIPAHTGTIPAVAFSPDGTRLASASQDGTAHFYVIGLDELISLAKSRLKRSMTAEECWTYLHTGTCPQAP